MQMAFVNGGGAPTYYVSQSGNDANAGTQASPWKNAPGMTSCASVCASTTLTPGATVKLNKGDQWYTTWTIPASGASNNPITFTSYGSGNQPIIDAGTLPSWTIGGGQSSQETCSGTDVFCSGFETAAFADWTGTVTSGTATITIDSSLKAHGSSSMKLVGDGSHLNYAKQTITATTSGQTLAMRAYIYTPSGAIQVSHTWNAMQFYKSGTAEGGVQFVTNSSGNIIQIQFSGSICNATAITWPLSTWNRVDAIIGINSGSTSGTVQFLINGVSVCNVSSVNTSAAVGSTEIRVGGTSAYIANGAIVNFDDFQLNTSDPGCFSAGTPTSVYTTSRNTSFNFLTNVTGNTTLSAVSPACLDSLTFPSGATNKYYWDSSTLFVYNPSNTNQIEIPTNAKAIDTNSKDYLTFDGIEAINATTNAFYVGPEFTSVTVKNGTASFCSYACIQYTATTSTGGSSGTGGLVTNNTFNYGGLAGSGISVGIDATGVYNVGTQITYNTGNYNYQDIECDQNSSNELIAYNTLTNATKGPSIINDHSSGCQIIYNTIAGTGVAGASTQGSAIQLADEIGTTANALVANNTAYNNYGGCISVGYGSDTYTSPRILNNLCQDNWQGVPREGFDQEPLIISSPTISSGTWDYNLYYRTTPGAGLFFNVNFSYYTFANWKTNGYSGISSLDPHSLTSNPTMTNPSAGDFTLQGGSPAIGAGLYIMGVSTANPPNIGAK